MIDIRKITAEDTLMVRHLVLWPDKPIDYVRISNDEAGEHFGLYLDNELLSVISIFITETEVQFRKFATLNKHQGKGYGSKLFEYMLDQLKEKNVTRVWCNARNDANDFYKRYGFSVVKDSVFYKGDIGYTVMQLKIEN